jgi:YegS/Rv2252/BmrU family lipid kinase
MSVSTTRPLVLLNPQAGSYTLAAVRAAIERAFTSCDDACDVHETSAEDDLTELARAAVVRGCELVVAAGGDGTVSAVANGLVGSEAALGIIPLGTANVLAGELRIPFDPEGACALLAGRHAIAHLDAMELDGRYYLTQVGIGIDALMIRDTTREGKRRFGRLAYLWTAFCRLLGFQPRRFRLCIDGQKLRPRASQVLLANSSTFGLPPFWWGPDIRPNDGRIDVCILRARTLFDYAVLAVLVLLLQPHSSRHVRYVAAARSIVVESDRPLPVQADGEIVGQTPIEVRVAAGVLRVIVPEGNDSA